MFDGKFRAPVDKAVKPLGDLLRRTKLTPDHLTIAGLVLGIGAAFARRMGRDGHRLVLGARRREELERVAAESGNALPVVTDVTRRAERRTARPRSEAGLAVPVVLGLGGVLVALALAATATERIEVGTSIAVAFARTPMAMAYSAYDLQRLSGGRLVLGLGSQIKPHITRRYGMPWSQPAARMQEYVQAMRAIWHAWQTGETLDFRGDYYTLKPEARALCRGLIYPVPDPSLPFLGVHFTKRHDGEVWAGPNAVLALAREGYRRRDVDWADTREVLGYSGFRALARQYWRTGAAEVWRDAVKRSFVKELQRYVPAVRSDQLVFGPSGVRAQALAPDGAMVDDFHLQEGPSSLHVLNAPSPAATASLAIAEMLADRTDAAFALGR